MRLLQDITFLESVNGHANMYRAKDQNRDQTYFI